MFYVGVDLGQRRDFTAVAVVERAEARFEWMDVAPDLTVRYLERVELGTPYTRVVERVGEVMRSRDIAGRASLVVDATGVGAPVVEMLRSAGWGGVLTAVTITGGERARGDGARWNVPREDLLSGVEVLLERGWLRVSRDLKEAGSLMKEMESMRGDGSESGEHDDLVLAVALGCWKARRGRNGFGGARLPGI